MIIELTLLGDKHIREFNPEIDAIDELKADKASIIESVLK